MIINVELWRKLTPEVQLHISAIHLKQNQLMQCQAEDLTLGRRYIAACHDVVSAQHAQKIGCDAILLSPVLPTATHPNDAALGWDKFEQIAPSLDIPVFALGGMQKELFAIAKQHGAYGIAGIRHI